MARRPVNPTPRYNAVDVNFCVLLVLVVEVRHLTGSVFCNFHKLRVSEQALGGIHQGFGIVVELSFHVYVYSYVDINFYHCSRICSVD